MVDYRSGDRIDIMPGTVLATERSNKSLRRLLNAIIIIIIIIIIIYLLFYYMHLSY